MDGIQSAAAKAVEKTIEDLRLDIKGSLELMVCSKDGIEISLFDKSRGKRISNNKVSPNSVVTIPLALEIDFIKKK